MGDFGVVSPKYGIHYIPVTEHKNPGKIMECWRKKTFVANFGKSSEQTTPVAFQGQEL